MLSLQEDVQQAENETQEGEEGEEEDAENDEELADDDVDGRSMASGFSFSAAGAGAPQAMLALGSLGSETANATKRRAVAKASQKAALDQGLSVEVGGAGDKGENVGPISVENDSVLKMMVEDLGYTPPCFAGLFPEEVLLHKKMVGRQLRGVWGFVKHEVCLQLSLCVCLSAIIKHLTLDPGPSH